MTDRLIRSTPSHTLRPMRKGTFKGLFLLAFLLLTAMPAFAQTTSREFGITIGATRRNIGNNDITPEPEGAFMNDEFSFSNNAVDLWWGVQIEPETFLKIKAGRINTPVREVTRVVRDDEDEIVEQFGRDVDGELQHIEANIEYRFSEAYGSTSLFGGVGLYRHSGGNVDDTNYGFNVGVNADFPIARNYGVVAEATYHLTRGEARPKYITVGVGLRFSY